MTKKDKLGNYDAVAKERDLLSLYLYDTTWNKNLDATEAHSETIKGERIKVTGKLYRSNGSDGGYVVISTLVNKDGRSEYIKRLDDCSTDGFSEYTLPERIVIDRLRMARHRIWHPSAEAVASA